MTVPIRLPGQTPGAVMVRPPLAPAHRTKPSFVLFCFVLLLPGPFLLRNNNNSKPQ